MGKRNPSEPTANGNTSFMFPGLHENVLEAISGEISSFSFNENDNDAGIEHEHSTNIVGKFKCRNKSCRTKGWTSGHVAIWIRGYSGDRYNAVVYNQRCKNCDGLGDLEVDGQSYVDRVAYRLKVWAGAPVPRPHFIQRNTPPHKRELCEGCKAGVCRQAGGSSSRSRNTT